MTTDNFRTVLYRLLFLPKTVSRVLRLFKGSKIGRYSIVTKAVINSTHSIRNICMYYLNHLHKQCSKLFTH